MAGLNRVMLIGNLGRDAELRFTPGGAPTLTFSLATTEHWTDKNGQKQEKTDWHRCVLWGKAAENLAEYMKKGTQLYAEGKLETRSWDDKKTGEKRYATEVKVSGVQLLGGGKREEQPASRPTRATRPEPVEELTDEEIPF